MRLGHPRRLVVYVALLALVAASGGSPHHESRTNEIEGSHSPEEATLVEFGLTRFEEHDLNLPPLNIEFFPDTSHCDGHLGLYHESERRLRMCSLDKRTMLHELAHAWANLNLSDEEKTLFAAVRGVRWNDRSDSWQERATEHAAEIIAWGLSDERYAIRWVTFIDGVPVSSFRLRTIENSSVETLHDGFVLLTGMEPIFRSSLDLTSSLLEHEWQETSGRSLSPESRPPTGSVDIEGEATDASDF